MKRKSLLFLLFFALLAPWAAMAQECEISYTLTDSYGDGWNGGALVVTDVTTSTQLANLTISSGSSLTGSIPVINEHEISFAYTTGSYAYENSWAIYDANGSLIWQGSGSDGSQTYSYVAVCPSCYMPQALAVTLTPGNGTIATLNWTAGGTETNWVLEYGTASDFTGATSVNVSGTPTQDLTGLTAETTYYARVKADCGNGDESGWTDPISFIPTNAYSITVNDGTSTNSYVPYYAYYHDASQRSEFIIPAASLTSMAWGTITSMKLYPNYSYTTTASIQVYLMEVEATTFSDVTFYTEDDATVVYNGTLTISPDGLTFNFDGDGFEYSGGNLLVGFYQASGGNGYYSSSACPFYGVNADGASISQYSSYSGLRNFLPKTTFEFTPGEAPTCLKPSGLEVGHITATSATATWTSGANETQWQLCINDDETNLILVDNNMYELTGLIPETDYTIKVRAYCSADDQSNWSSTQTFTTEVACPAPSDVTVSDITATSATVSWTGEANSYNLRYRELTAEDFATITLYAEDVWQDGTGYQLLLDADANTYGTIIPETGGLTSSGNASAATYAEFEYKIPVNADGAMNTTNVVIAESITIQVPAGTYDWCVTNPTPGDRIWIASSGGTIGGRYDDYEFRGGNTYEFHVYADASTGNDAVDLTVTETGSAKDDEWTEINDVTSPYTLNVEPEKDYLVEVQANCGEYLSSWARTNFSTPSNCQVPTPLDVTDITAYTATLNWSGLQDSYQVQYRTKGSRELLFFEDFDGQPSTWTLTNTVYNTTSSATTDYLAFIGSGSTETAYLITPDLTDIVSVGTVEFMQRVYNGTATFQVGFSSTTNDVDAFTWGEEVSAAAVMFTAYDIAMPAGTKYVAIKSTTETENCAVLINDFGIYGNEIPAGQWNTATANTTSCPISGLVADTEYEWQVRGVNESCDGGYTDWCELVTFTTEVSCPVPTDVTVSDVTGESAVIAWTSDASLFDIDVNGVVTNDVTNPYTLENLEPETIYTVKVRANCGDGDYSEWTTGSSFVTNCGGAKDLPYTYGFEDMGEYYACWFAQSFNTANAVTLAYDPADETNIVFRFSSYSTASDYRQILVSPELNTEAAVAVQFDYKTSNTSAETFQVGYATDDFTSLDDFTFGDAISVNNNTEWATYSETFPAGTKYVAVLYSSNYQYYMYVDNFKFEESLGVTQSFNLEPGWNNISLFIKADDDPVAMLDMLKEGLGDNAEMIEGEEGITSYEGDGEWFGDLDEYGLSNERSYSILVTNDCSFELVGTPTNPADYVITINPGWNMIGFPSAVELEIAVALSEFEAEIDDIIEGPDGMTMHEGDGEWFGDIESFVPGQGYLYFSNSDEVKYLVFQTGGEKARRSVAVSGSLTKQPVKVQVMSAAAKAMSGGVQKQKDSVKKINK